MRAAAARHVRPEAMVFVVVADAESVAPGLERLGWAQVERYDDQVEANPNLTN
jgi:hypothetical protein